MIKETTINQLKEKIDKKEEFILIDVRTEEEMFFGKINYNSLFIPLHEIPSKIQGLDKEKEIITYCRSGERSSFAASYLSKHGFTKVSNLKGGILAWRKFDSAIIPY